MSNFALLLTSEGQRCLVNGDAIAQLWEYQDGDETGVGIRFLHSEQHEYVRGTLREVAEALLGLKP